MPLSCRIILDSHTTSLLADPVGKKPVGPAFFPVVNGVIDARVFLKNTYGFLEWKEGQEKYEETQESTVGLYEKRFNFYLEEIAYDRPIYEHFYLDGTVLDVGGVGTVREFLRESVHYVSIDPYIEAPFRIPLAKLEAYKSLSRPLNFIAAMAEFVPFVCKAFDWVHMRTVLDHVQVPDLSLLEALRVLKQDGHVLIGLYVEGGKSGRISSSQRMKKILKRGLQMMVGIERWKDHHTWHPTYKGAVSIILCKIPMLPADPKSADFFALSREGLTSNAIPS